MFSHILMTGGGGRLGTELKKSLPGILTPRSSEMDITSEDSTAGFLDRHSPRLVVHAAAYTDVAGAEKNKAECFRINVQGTRNVVRQAMLRNLDLVHISTDYVFEGKTGNYREDDPVGPVLNYYSLSKLVAEEIVRLASGKLIIRTSFRPSVWEHPKAFTDIYTSQDYVDVIAPDIALTIRNFKRIPFDVLHIATERKSVFDLAARRNPDVVPGLKKEAGVILPDDISMDVSRWLQLRASLVREEQI